MTRFIYPLLLLGLLPACTSDTPITEPDAQSDPFEIVLSQFPAEPGIPPALDGDTLQIRVQYEGECRDHTFSLSQQVQRDTTLLAVRHDANGDACEAQVYDEIRLGLPDPLPPSGVVLLRNPQGGAPFLLRSR